MDDVTEQIRVHKVDDLGIEGGLTVVMEPSLEDYFYPILPIVGWKVSQQTAPSAMWKDQLQRNINIVYIRKRTI